MKSILLILTTIISMSCGQTEGFTTFCDEYKNSDLDLQNGIEVSDSLGYFTYRIPDSTWRPIRTLGHNENGLTVGDTSQGYMRLFNVNQSEYANDWNWEEEQKKIEKEFNVIEKGQIHLNGQERYYNLVHFESDTPQIITFYVSVLDPTEKRLYTLAISTEYAKDYKSRICKMIQMMKSFKIKN